MTDAIQELQQFTKFAQHTLEVANANLSLEDCVQLWRQQREFVETVEDIQQGRTDYEAGAGEPVTEVADEIRRVLGFSQ